MLWTMTLLAIGCGITILYYTICIFSNLRMESTYIQRKGESETVTVDKRSCLPICRFRIISIVKI